MASIPERLGIVTTLQPAANAAGQPKETNMTTYYLIRLGWNAANQSAAGGRSGPRDTFESRLDTLVEIVQADSPEEAVAKCSASMYANQSLSAVSNPRAIKGLTREIKSR